MTTLFLTVPKISLRYHYNRQEVTGLTVNTFPNLRRSYIKQLRAILHHCEESGIFETAQQYVTKGYCKNKSIKDLINEQDKQDIVQEWFKKVLIGKVNYIKQIKGCESLTYLSFAQKLNSIFNEQLLDISALNTLDELISQNTYILECKEGEVWDQGSGFYLEGYGLFTNHHVTECGGFFKVFTHKSYSQKPLGMVCKELNEISSCKDIDYALYKPSFATSGFRTFEAGDSTKLRIGDQVTIIGYPNHDEGNSPYIQTCSITSMKNKYLGAFFYTVSGRIVHGASGGVVLNNNFRVVGIIKGGIVTLSEDDTNENQGFIPIHLVFEDLNKKLISE